MVGWFLTTLSYHRSLMLDNTSQDMASICFLIATLNMGLAVLVPYVYWYSAFSLFVLLFILHLQVLQKTQGTCSVTDLE